MKVRKLGTRSWVWLVNLTVGGAVFAFSSCDPEVKSTMLSGVQTAVTGLVTTFIDAVFIILARDDDTTSSTVRAVFEHLDRFFC